MEDFNEIMEESEKSGKSRRPRGHMEKFRDTMALCKLQDMGFCGPKYTWYNRREGSDFVEERLDRAFANQDWFDLFPRVQLEILLTCSSDHAPMYLFFFFF